MELKSSSQVHSISSFNNHLLSSIVTLYILILLYFPTIFLNIVFSPVFISTGILLVYLLKLGASQESQKGLFSAISLQTHDYGDKNKPNQTYSVYPTCPTENKMYGEFISNAIEPSNNEDYIWDSCDLRFGNGDNSFVEWNVKAPLQIIYEDEEEDDDSVKRENCIDRYSSLSLYYPESDTDCSSDDGDFAMDMNWESSESAAATWGEIGDELIEIALDGKSRSQFFNDEEDTLIEIDISPGRNNEFSGQC